MDVRLSPVQQALRHAAVRVVERQGPQTVRDLDEGERAGRLDAAVEESGWRELRSAIDGGGPLASGVEAALVAEELGRGVADVPYLGPTWPPNCGDEPVQGGRRSRDRRARHRAGVAGRGSPPTACRTAWRSTPPARHRGWR